MKWDTVIWQSRPDPAIAKHDNAWSRRRTNRSKILIVYPHHHGQPHMAPIHIAESSESCHCILTPNDLSLTYVPFHRPKPPTIFNTPVRDVKLPLRNSESSIQDFPFRDNRE